MSRLSGHSVQVGGAFRLDPIEEKQKEVVHAIILEAESKAYKILESARNEASDLLAQARQNAEALVSDAKSQCEAILQSAYDEGEKAGAEKGYQDGYARAEQETKRLLEGANILLEGAYQSRERVLKGFKESAARVIQHITANILKESLIHEPDLLMELVDKAVESLHLTGKVRVVVSAEMLETIRQFSSKTETVLEGMKRYDFVADPGLGATEIFVINEEGNFSLSPEQQVKQLLRPIVNSLPVDADMDMEPEDLEPEEIDSVMEETVSEMETIGMDEILGEEISE